MLDHFTKTFSSGGFMPHGMCYQWQPDVLWTHVLSDLVVAIAYFSIPLALVILMVRRRQMPFKWLVGLFAAFILLCGTTHVLGIVVVWEPLYRLQGFVKLATAAVSIATAVVVFPLLPQLLEALGVFEKQLRDDRGRIDRAQPGERLDAPRLTGGDGAA